MSPRISPATILGAGDETMPTDVRSNPYSKHKALPVDDDLDSCSDKSSEDGSDDDSDNGKQK